MLREAKGMKEVCIPVFDVMLCRKRRYPPYIAVCGEIGSEGFDDGCTECLGHLVDIGLNLSLTPSVGPSTLVNTV
jgi:hypothetical protein